MGATMDAEIIAIGSELLLGATIDTNSAYLGQQLAHMGIMLRRVTLVGDDLAHIVAAVRQAHERSELVICTGGLGPTEDDRTREAVAQALGCPLEFRQELFDQVAARFAAMQYPMSATNRVQAYVPEGARAIANPHGTAPSFLVETADGVVVVLPGVPAEMRAIFEASIVPYLRNERGAYGTLMVRTLTVAGMGESALGERIADLMQTDNPAVGTSAKQGVIGVRIAARAESSEEASALIDPIEEQLRERLGPHVVSTEPLNQFVARLLKQHGYSLAIYEGNSHAPLYRALSATPEGMERVRGVAIHPRVPPVFPCVAPTEGQTDEEALSTLACAAASALRRQWETTLAIGIQAPLTPSPSPDAPDHFTPVSIVLDSGDQTRQHTRRYDLRLPEGWDHVGNQALNLLRRHLVETWS